MCSHERSPVDEALGKLHQDAVLALVDSWGKQAQADSLGAEDVLITEDSDSAPDPAMQKHLPAEGMDLG